MGVISEFVGVLISYLMFGLVVAGVIKIFQLASDVRELKGVLVDIRRNTQEPIRLPVAPAALGVSGAPTAEELVRAVHAQTFGDDFPL